MWFIKSEYKNKDGQPTTETQRVPVTGNVREQLLRAIDVILLETLAKAADDNSDLTVTIAFVGDR